MWGNLRNDRWGNRIQFVGLVCCLYAIYVGWLAAVLDGPGFVLNPLQLAAHVIDPSNHGIWIEAVPVIDLRPELSALGPYLFTLRLAELAWLTFVGFFSFTGQLPFPFCQSCKRWMLDSTMLRLKYDAVETEQVRRLANDLVAGRYDALLELDNPVAPKEKGLEISVIAVVQVTHLIFVGIGRSQIPIRVKSSSGGYERRQSSENPDRGAGALCRTGDSKSRLTCADLTNAFSRSVVPRQL